MAPKTSRISRRNVLKKAAVVGGGAAATLLGGDVAVAQAPAVLTGTQVGRRYRAFIVSTNAQGTTIQSSNASVQQVTMRVQARTSRGRRRSSRSIPSGRGATLRCGSVRRWRSIRTWKA